MSTGKEPSEFIIWLAMASVFAALVYVATTIFIIPIPATSGYLNLGDTVIYVAALLFGPFVGAFGGGIGASVADILSGFGFFAPGTFVIKGVEGFLVGYLNLKLRGLSRNETLGAVVSVLVGGAEMVAGYFLYEVFVLSYGIGAALLEVPFNVFQMSVGLIVAVPVSTIVLRVFPQLRSWRLLVT